MEVRGTAYAVGRGEASPRQPSGLHSSDHQTFSITWLAWETVTTFEPSVFTLVGLHVLHVVCIGTNYLLVYTWKDVLRLGWAETEPGACVSGFDCTCFPASLDLYGYHSAQKPMRVMLSKPYVQGNPTGQQEEMPISVMIILGSFFLQTGDHNICIHVYSLFTNKFLYIEIT